MSFFNKIKEGFKKTKEAFDEKLTNVFKGNKEVDEMIEELEEALVLSDIGMETSLKVCDNLKTRIKKEKITEPEEIKEALRKELLEILNKVDEENDSDEKKVILVTGVNGVGKTTSIGKLSNILKKQGKKVLVAAADTFRAGAVEQVKIWADRAGVDLVCGKENEDPASVVYKATEKYLEGNYDILICDTAGRLHNKKNLMDELEKMKRIIDKNITNIKKDTYIVLDGTTGQNALVQAKNFYDRTNVNGIIVTKLDGTAKGGTIFSIVDELNIPVKYIGLGEGIDDLQEFNSEEFVRSII